MKGLSVDRFIGCELREQLCECLAEVVFERFEAIQLDDFPAQRFGFMQPGFFVLLGEQLHHDPSEIQR